MRKKIVSLVHFHSTTEKKSQNRICWSERKPKRLKVNDISAPKAYIAHTKRNVKNKTHIQFFVSVCLDAFSVCCFDLKERKSTEQHTEREYAFVGICALYSLYSVHNIFVYILTTYLYACSLFICQFCFVCFFALSLISFWFVSFVVYSLFRITLYLRKELFLPVMRRKHSHTYVFCIGCSPKLECV